MASILQCASRAAEKYQPEELTYIQGPRGTYLCMYVDLAEKRIREPISRGTSRHINDKPITDSPATIYSRLSPRDLENRATLSLARRFFHRC